MVIISKYKIKCKNGDNRLKVISYDTKQCPACGGDLIVIGSRKRHFINELGDELIVDIRKLGCESCGRVHSELPDAIFPYHRLCAKTIKLIIEGDKFNAVCDHASYDRIRKWWAIFSRVNEIDRIDVVSCKINRGVISHTHFEHIKNDR